MVFPAGTEMKQRENRLILKLLSKTLDITVRALVTSWFISQWICQ